MNITYGYIEHCLTENGEFKLDNYRVADQFGFGFYVYGDGCPGNKHGFSKEEAIDLFLDKIKSNKSLNSDRVIATLNPAG